MQSSIKTHEGLIALVTGANKGIGLSTAKQLLGLGYQVYIGVRDEAKGRAAIEQLNAKGFSKASLLEMDVSDAVSVDDAVLRFSSLAAPKNLIKQRE